MQNYSHKVTMALQQRKEFVGGLLLGERVFVKETEGNKDHKEMLVLMYANAHRPFIWAHIFPVSEGQEYVTGLVGIEDWFNACSAEQAFERFKWHITWRGDWHPLDSLHGSGKEVFALSKSFEEAVDALVEMIKIFDIDHVCGYDDEDSYKTDYRVLNFYPFPACNADIPPLPGL